MPSTRWYHCYKLTGRVLSQKEVQFVTVYFSLDLGEGHAWQPGVASCLVSSQVQLHAMSVYHLYCSMFRKKVKIYS